jgi:hypothetical protein
MQIVHISPGYILTYSVALGVLIFLSRNRNKQRTRNQKPPKERAHRDLLKR